MMTLKKRLRLQRYQNTSIFFHKKKYLFKRIFVNDKWNWKCIKETSFTRSSGIFDIRRWKLYKAITAGALEGMLNGSLRYYLNQSSKLNRTEKRHIAPFWSQWDDSIQRLAGNRRVNKVYESCICFASKGRPLYWTSISMYFMTSRAPRTGSLHSDFWIRVRCKM